MSADTPRHWSDAGDLSALDLDDAAHPFAVGERHRYEPGAELGRGGMGRVVRARDRRLLRDVALKQPADGAGAAAGRRLAQEAWVTAQLDHLGIVAVHDAGLDADGRPWYVMRVVRGQTLARLLEGRDLDGRLELLRALRDACEAVGYAHRRGFVHRDLKPANVMVGSFGETQVMDWGLARPAPGPTGARWRAHLPPELAAHTAQGALLGTPAYLSPEQVEGRSADPRSDVFSLGLVLYELLAGRRAFQGPDSQAVLVQVRAAVLPELDLPERLAPLRSLCRRATAADPADRLADAKDLADELTRFLEGRRVEAHRYAPAALLRETLAAWWAPLGLVTAGLCVAAVVAGAALVDARAEAERATQAEALADENLRLALISQARTASRAGDRGRAETLAAHALQLGEDPTARGILLDARPRPSLLAEGASLDCGRLDLDPTGRFAACLQGEELSLWDLDEGALQWTQRVANAGRAWVDEAGWVVASSGDRHRLLDGSGHLIEEIEGSGVPAWLPGRRGLWLASHGLYVRSESGGVEPLYRCRDGSGDAVAARGDRLVGVCFGEVFVLEEAGLRTFPTLPLTEEVGFPQLAAIDGERLVWASQNGHLVAHDLATGAHLWTTHLPVGSVLDLSLREGLLGVVGVRSGVHLLDPASGRVLAVLPELEGALAVGHRDGRVRVTGATTQLWELPSLPPQRVEGGITALDFSADGQRLAVGHGDGASILDWQAGQLRRLRQEPYPSTVKSVDLLPDGRLLLGLSTEQHLLDAELQLLETRPTGGRRLAWMQGDLILRAPYAQTGPVLFHLGGDPVANIQQLDRAVTDIDVGADGSQAVWANADGVWWMSAADSRPTLRLPLPHAVVAAVGPGWVLGGTRARVAVVDDEGQPVWSREDPARRLMNARFSDDGRYLALGYRDGSARVVEATSGRVLAELEGHLEQVPGLAFHPGGHTLVTGSWDRGLRSWDLARLDRSPAVLLGQVEAAWGLGLDEALR